MIISLFDAALTADDVFRLMSFMFHKSSPTKRTNSMPAPFCSENPPPEVGIFILFDLILFC
jgi:hypothetical protein